MWQGSLLSLKSRQFPGGNFTTVSCTLLAEVQDTEGLLESVLHCLNFCCIDAENMANEGYQSMLQNLIRFLKNDRKCWVRQGELFGLTILDRLVSFLIALYHLEKSGDRTDIEGRVFEVLLYVR